MKTYVLIIVFFGYSLSYGQTKILTKKQKILFNGTIGLLYLKEASLEVSIGISNNEIDSFHVYGNDEGSLIGTSIIISNIDPHFDSHMSLGESVDRVIVIKLKEGFGPNGGVVTVDIKFEKNKWKHQKIFIAKNIFGEFNAYLLSIDERNKIEKLNIELKLYWFSIVTKSCLVTTKNKLIKI